MARISTTRSGRARVHASSSSRRLCSPAATLQLDGGALLLGIAVAPM